jgi:EAL domain-containing protein (putative c-di-GMP-specific phosphodiesterase class I)/CheY-like chemotaxis protein
MVLCDWRRIAATGVAGKDHMTNTKGRVLLVDDEPAILRVFANMLRSAGFAVETAPEGDSARELLQHSEFDAVLSDISMPGMDGLGLLRAVRKLDLDLPVILITANPTVDTAVQALEFGALRYLFKPTERKVLVSAVEYAVRVNRMAKIKRQAQVELGMQGQQAGDRAGLETSFEQAIHSLWVAYQPIVSVPKREIFGYEALLRTTHQGLPTPAAMLDAAERLGTLHMLGQTVRAAVAQTAVSAPAERKFFVNLHPHDLEDESLYSSRAPLSEIASRVVLEVTERASLDGIKNLGQRLTRLRNLGYQIALDDLGAGYAGLTTFARLEPEFVKLDMSLVRNVQDEPVKRKLIGSMASMCKDMHIQVIAEGVESAAERDTVELLECGLQQGYLFARPEKPFPSVSW